MFLDFPITIFLETIMAGNYVLRRGGRTKMAIRSRGGGQGGGWRGVEHYPLAGWVAQRMYVGCGCLHQFCKNVNGSRPISVVGET